MPDTSPPPRPARPLPESGPALRSTVSRRLRRVLGVGTVLLVLLVFVVASLVELRSVFRERARLGEVIAASLSRSVSGLSTAGKHHVRRLVADVGAQHRDTIRFVQVLDPERTVIAHSDGSHGGADNSVQAHAAMRALSGDAFVLRADASQNDAVDVFVAPLRGGFDRKPVGVVLVGVTVMDTLKALERGPLLTALMLALFLAVFLPLVLRWVDKLMAPIEVLAKEHRAVLAHAPLYIVTKDRATGHIASSSDAFRRAFQDPDHALSDVEAALDEVESPAAPGTNHVVHVRAGGDRRALLTTRFSLVPGGQASAAQVCVIATDVTDERRLASERDRLVRAIACTPDAVFITEADGAIVYENPAAQASMQAHALDTVVSGDGPSVPWCLHPQASDTQAQRALRLSMVRLERWHGRVTRASDTADGASTFDVMLSPIRGGTSVQFVWLCRDVTHEVELERGLQQAQRLDAVGRLAGGIAHDFNNLLTVINGAAALLAFEDELSAEVRESVDTISQAGERAATLTRQLLAFGRRQHLTPEPLDLSAQVRRALPLLESLCGARTSLAHDLAHDLWVTSADAGQLDQVLTNLVMNARDSAAADGVIQVRTANHRVDAPTAVNGREMLPGDYVLLAVHNDGAPMPADVAPHVFEPFFTTKDVGKGTGLGLASVLGIVRQSKGHVWFDSDERGTTFYVALPRTATLPVRDDVPNSAGELEGGDEVILVVEDDAAVRKTIRSILFSAGYTVQEAENGARALELLQSGHPPDLVLSDIVMPRMTGPELVAALPVGLSAARVVFMSGYQASALDDAAHTAGIPLVAKPPKVSELLRAVRTRLDAAARDTDPATAMGAQRLQLVHDAEQPQ